MRFFKQMRNGSIASMWAVAVLILFTIELFIILFPVFKGVGPYLFPAFFNLFVPILVYLVSTGLYLLIIRNLYKKSFVAAVAALIVVPFLTIVVLNPGIVLLVTYLNVGSAGFYVSIAFYIIIYIAVCALYIVEIINNRKRESIT